MLDKIDQEKIIIDTDPGIDDALALAIATNLENVEVKLITTIAGNVSLKHTTQNTLDILALLNKDIKVAQGCDRPILKPFRDASYVHGQNGLGNVIIPTSKQKPLTIHAVEAIKEELMNSDTPITIITLAALTNIAYLLRLYPEVKPKIKQIIMMGGGIEIGNATSVAEFNFFVDPHAASIVFDSGLDLTMVGLNATLKALLTKEEILPLNHGSKVQQFFFDIFNYYKDGNFEQGLAMHDVCTLAYLVKPEIFKVKTKEIVIETVGFANGACVVNNHALQEQANLINVCMDIDTQAFQKWLSALLLKL